jgi:hypothetical protein
MTCPSAGGIVVKVVTVSSQKLVRPFHHGVFDRKMSSGSPFVQWVNDMAGLAIPSFAADASHGV